MLLANLPIKYQIDIKAVGSVITFSWHTRTKQNNTDTLGWLYMFNSKSPLVQKSPQNRQSPNLKKHGGEQTQKSKKQCLLGGIMWSSVTCLCGRRCFQELCSGGVVIHLPETAYERCVRVFSGDTSRSLVFGNQKSPQTYQVTDSRVSTGGHLWFIQQWTIKMTTFDID